MSLAFGDVMTALDLCADAVFLACGELPDATGRFYDLVQSQEGASAPFRLTVIRAWIGQLPLVVND